METKTDRQERIPHFEQASIRNAKAVSYTPLTLPTTNFV